jgi:hypothetical protein
MPTQQIDDSQTDDKYKAFYIKRSNLTLLGGYNNGGTTYNPDLYKATLSGDIG